MTYQLKPETTQLVQEELRNGHFRSLDELIGQSLLAWHERHPATQNKIQRPEGRKSLAQLFAESPFKGLAMEFGRFQDRRTDK